MQALLVTQLNGLLQAPYTATFVPLHITILVLLVTTCVKSPANPLWFGLRKVFSDFVLDTCPFLQEYANISLQRGQDDEEELVDNEKVADLSIESKKPKRTKEKLEIEEALFDTSVYPYEDIMMPD